MIIKGAVVILAVVSLIFLCICIVFDASEILLMPLEWMFRGRKPRRGRKLLKNRIKTGIILSAVTAGCAALLYVGVYSFRVLNTVQQQAANDLEDVVINEGLEEKEALEECRLIALFGLDNQENDIQSSNNRSDCIIIAALCKKTKEIRLISVYRDTYMSINGNYDKVNAAYAWGGPSLAVSTLNRNLDLNIQDYVTVNFQCLAKAVDIMGGVTLTIETKKELDNLNDYIGDMNRINGGKSPRFEKIGTYTFDGNQAVAYTRIRYMEGGDHARAGHQRKVLSALFHKVKHRPWKIFKLMDLILPEIRTSLSKEEMGSLARTALSYKLTDNSMSSYPSDSYDVRYRRIYYGFPVTVGENVKTLHSFIYQTEEYDMTDELKRIAKKVRKVTDELGLE